MTKFICILVGILFYNWGTLLFSSKDPWLFETPGALYVCSVVRETDELRNRWPQEKKTKNEVGEPRRGHLSSLLYTPLSWLHQVSRKLGLVAFYLPSDGGKGKKACYFPFSINSTSCSLDMAQNCFFHPLIPRAIQKRKKKKNLCS